MSSPNYCAGGADADDQDDLDDQYDQNDLSDLDDPDDLDDLPRWPRWPGKPKYLKKPDENSFADDWIIFSFVSFVTIFLKIYL